MKKSLIIFSFLTLLMASCNKVKRNPGRDYMPDMRYSRAYETYAGLDSSKFTTDPEEIGEGKIFYNATPVNGTRARGELPAFYYGKDSAGYRSASAMKNPLPALGAKDYLEAARLYQINCAICHGVKLDGQGPLFVSGKYPAAPRNLMGADMKALSDGSMYHVMTYGKGVMGSYASQLNSQQRWMIVHYIREKQGGATSDTTKVEPVNPTGVTPGAVSTSPNQNSKEDARKQ